MANQRLIKLLQRHTRPKSTYAFTLALIYNVVFKYDSNQAPTATNFRPFYTALLILRKDFIKCYEIISENNEDNIPPTND